MQARCSAAGTRSAATCGCAYAQAFGAAGWLRGTLTWPSNASGSTPPRPPVGCAPASLTGKPDRTRSSIWRRGLSPRQAHASSMSPWACTETCWGTALCPHHPAPSTRRRVILPTSCVFVHQSYFPRPQHVSPATVAGILDVAAAMLPVTQSLLSSLSTFAATYLPQASPPNLRHVHVQSIGRLPTLASVAAVPVPAPCEGGRSVHTRRSSRRTPSGGPPCPPTSCFTCCAIRTSRAPRWASFGRWWW